MMQIPDPIHGYITLEGMYADIVNTPEFQRLRSIEQGSFRPVYPGARHDRFIHSLGTYHLAEKFSDHFFRNLDADLNIKLSPAEEELLRNTFCYAALLHDIGHAPFSHTTENFFKEPIAPNSKKKFPKIWVRLCDDIRAVDAREGLLFSHSHQVYGAAHEIASSIVLIEQWQGMTNPKRRLAVDLPLAARMVIGFPYTPGDLGLSPTRLGVRNCLIQMLNSKLMDVDRLDYLGRDTQMSGYTNAPMDLDRLASSVTAVHLQQIPIGKLGPDFTVTIAKDMTLVLPEGVTADLPKNSQVKTAPAHKAGKSAVVLPEDYPVRKPDGTPDNLKSSLTVPLPGDTVVLLPDGWLFPAYRDSALAVFDLMFQAKLSHDAWVLANPAGVYDAALLAHCIRDCYGSHMYDVFDVDSLSRQGRTVGQKTYRLLSDVDVAADLKARTGGNFDELHTRVLGERRTAAWRSYYEFHHLFNAPELGITPEDVHKFFSPLLKHMENNNIFVFDKNSYAQIIGSGGHDVIRAAYFMRIFLRNAPTDPAKKGTDDYSAVLLKRTNNLLIQKVDPEQIYITFRRNKMPLRTNRQDFSSYAELTHLLGRDPSDNRSYPYFYLFRHSGLGSSQLTDLRTGLARVICAAKANNTL